MKKTHVIQVLWMREPGWLAHVNNFFKIFMKKRIFNIQLSYMPVRLDCKSENKANTCWFYNRTKSVIEINTLNLIVSFSDETCFVPIKRTIGFQLGLKNPFRSNNMQGRVSWNKSPSSMKSSKFIMHCSDPVWLMKSISKREGFVEATKAALAFAWVIII